MAFSELDLMIRYPFRGTNLVLIDVGAHHGFFSTPFADSGWQVIAFEPERDNREVFIETLGHRSNVLCLEEAVTDKIADRIPFYVSREHYGIHSIKPFHESHELAYEVETTTLDEVLSQLALHQVTLVKIDTEGADFLALKGLSLDKYKPQAIVIEFMDTRSSENFGYTHHDVVDFARRSGYVAFVSEWAAIREYGREDEQGEPHTWLQCAPYPLDHEPVWGNLILVPEADKGLLSKTLDQYLNEPEPVPGVWPVAGTRRQKVRNAVKKIPGARSIYRILKGR